jgi:hypothetical protein
MDAPSTENPFPGMNPYLEESWDDVHTRLIAYIADALSELLPADLHARTEEREVFLENGRPFVYKPDVSVILDGDSWKSGIAPQWQPVHTDDLETTEPVIVFSEDEMERWIEIREAGGRLITAIELLSPSNKNQGAASYIQKRQNYLASGVNLVEIDLLRAGRHIMAVPATLLSNAGGARYLVCVTRAALHLRHELYYCPLRQRLPSIRIPLRETDADVRLALQPLVDRCYKTGRYWQTDFTRLPGGPLPSEDALWLEERLRAAGLREQA